MKGEEAFREREASEIIDRLKPRLRPTLEEIRKAMDAFKEIKAIIEGALNETLKGIDYSVELEGSVAKGTAISGDLDLDIFILLNKKDLNNAWLRESVVEPLVRKFSGITGYGVSLRYASHPYIHLITPSGVEADLVPAYRASSPTEILTPVDRTPFHTRYINEHLSEDLKDEVRLLKKFLKSVGVYGAEIKSEGFSGYLCELLILKYGNFLNLLKGIMKWREPQVVIIDEDVATEASELRKVFKSAPLIVPDPVDPRRNAAASVSRRSLALTMIASYEFLLSPSERFFNPPQVGEDPGTLEEVLHSTGRSSVVVIWRMRCPIPPDVMWGEVKSAGRSLANVLKSRGFVVTDIRFWDIEELCLMAAYIEVFKTFDNYVLRRGPPRLGPELLKFIHKHLNESPVHAWVGYDGTPYAITRVGKSFNDVVSEYVNTHPPKHAEVAIVCNDLGCAISALKEKVGPNAHDILNRFIYWLTEAVLKTPPWLAGGDISTGST